jgi:CheY-like chemotaxis protein
MNALLIHNYNVKEELIGFFSENASELHFDIPQAAMLRENYSFDQEAHRQLYQHFEKKSEYDVIFLPYTLSNQNYLEFTGLRIAAHIRFTEEFNNQFTPVVFIGPDKPEEVLKLSALGNIIFTPGFFSTDKQDMESLTKQYEWIQNNKPSISNEEFQSFVERINIEPPANYRSHHSVDNDWALLRWSQYIGCENEIDEVRDNLETGLYFKWLKAKYGGMSEIPDKKQFHIDNNANILLIDDEATKGWKAFYESFFNNSPEITFQSLDLDFNLVGKDEVIEQAKNKIYDWDPDIILLDLRLSDEDFAPDIKPTEMTGYQILEKTKAINSGIQVIITTASNKIWNYKALQEAGADDFLMKSMESQVDKDVSYLFHAVKNCSKRKFLKKLELDIKAIKNDLALKSLSYQFVNEFKNQLDLSFSLLKEASKNINVGSTSPSNDKTKEEKKFAYAFISLYPTIELVNSEYLTQNNNNKWEIEGVDNLYDWEWDNYNNSYSYSNTEFYEKNPPEWKKIAGIYFQKWGKSDSKFVKDIFRAGRKRNGFVHNDTSILDKTDTRNNYLNHDIYSHKGFMKLFERVKEIATYL